MRRKISLCLLLVGVLSVFAGCSSGGYEDAVLDEAFMLEKSRELAERVCELADSGAAYVLTGGSEEIMAHLAEIADCDAADADEIYLLSGNPSMKRVLRVLETDEYGELSSEDRELLRSRVDWATLLPTQCNAVYGEAVLLAAASCAQIGESYRVEEIGDTSYLMVMVNDSRFAVAVSFRRGGEGIVSANATPLVGDALEHLEEYADALGIDFEELDVDALE